MYIHRSNPGKRFTQIPNETLRDERLSFKARGVLCELLSHADDWDMTADRLSASTQGRAARGAGRDAMRTVFAELETAGYLVRVRKQLPRGRFATELHLFDRPVPPGGADILEISTSAQAGKTGVSGGGADVLKNRPSAGQASNRTPSTNTQDGPSDLASRRGRAKRATATRTVSSVIANVRTAAAMVHGKQEAEELSDGHALGLYFRHAHRKDVHDLVAYLAKIFGDAPHLDTFIANAGWCCPDCQRWEEDCDCAA